MHRDNHRYGSEPRRGLCSKQFAIDLRHQGLARDEAIEVVSQVFGIPWGAARLFILAHPAWADDEERPMTVQWRS